MRVNGAEMSREAQGLRLVAAPRNTSGQGLACGVSARVHPRKGKSRRPQDLCRGWTSALGHTFPLNPVLVPVAVREVMLPVWDGGQIWGSC